jgi:hypothetical protein
MTEAAAWSYRPRRNYPVLRRWVLAKYPPVSIPNQNRRARLALLALFVAPFVISLASTPVQGASNEPPAIWGKPPTYAPRDVLYSFTPRAADADGDRLTFSIVNKPKWMWFDTRTGQLRGEAQVGAAQSHVLEHRHPGFGRSRDDSLAGVFDQGQCNQWWRQRCRRRWRRKR